MRLLSAESIEATFLHLLGLPYKEIASIFQVAPNTVKYHVFQVRKAYPDIEQFFFENVSVIPEALEEKIDLAKRLTELFKARKAESQEKTPEPSHPSLLLEAIDRSVSTYYEEPQNYEELEKEEKKDEKIKQHYWILVAALGILVAALFVSFRKPSKEEKIVYVSPKRPSTIKLSHLGVI